MTDAAIWLLRWTLAGAALCTIVVAAEYLLQRLGRAQGLGLFRVSLVALLAAPLIALAPPVLSFSTPTPRSAESNGLTSRPEAPPTEHPPTSTSRAYDARPWRLADIDIDAFAGMFFVLWASGALFVAMRHWRAQMRLARAYREGAPYPARFVACRLSPHAPTPLVFGLLRPRMLAPANFADWSSAEREAVLRHEAAHLRRADLVWAALSDAVGVLYWWAPPVDKLIREHMLVTEEACDATALGEGEGRHEYARALLAITRRIGRHEAGGLAVTGPSLQRRIERLICAPKKASAIAAPTTALATSACVALALTGPAAAALDRFRLYILSPAADTSLVYAFSDGAHATAAEIRSCTGQLVPNATAIVEGLEARIHNGAPDELDPVWIVGPGSGVELGECQADEPREQTNEDALVVVSDMSASQVHRFIGQMELSRSDQNQMLAALHLGERR